MCIYTELLISMFTFMNISIYQLSLAYSLSLSQVLVLWQTRTEKQKSLRTEMYQCGLQTCLQLPVSRNVRGKGLWLPPLKNLCAVHLTKTNIKLQFIILLNNFYMQKYQKNIFDSNSFRKTRTLISYFFLNLFVWSEAFCCIRWFMNTVCLCTSTPRTEKCGWWKKEQSKTVPKVRKKNHFVPPTVKFQNTSFSNNSYKLLTEMSSYYHFFFLF